MDALIAPIMQSVDVCNKAIEIALAEQSAQQALTALPENLLPPESKKALGDWIDSEQEYITAEEARELGAGKAEWFDDAFKQWKLCTPDICNYHSYFKYRAIKQHEPLDLSNIKGVGRNFEIKPEPVDPHAELKAMYEQQTRNGTTEFYLWEFLYLKTNEWRVIPVDVPPLFINPVQYRCTPKPTCQVRNPCDIAPFKQWKKVFNENKEKLTSSCPMWNETKESETKGA